MQTTDLRSECCNTLVFIVLGIEVNLSLAISKMLSNEN